MKKFTLLLTLALLILSCEKNYLVPEKDVPAWLKDRIKQDERKIRESPQLSYSYGAWVRFEFQADYYFEYHNPLSSSGAEIRDSNGNHILLIQEPFINYNSEKCCKQFVWKAEHFSGMPGL